METFKKLVNRSSKTSSNNEQHHSRAKPHTTQRAGGASQRRSPLQFPDGVQVLYEHENAEIDICFIHGLTGNRASTWTADGCSAPWPKILLAPKLDKVRILTYGYDAYVVRKSVAGTNWLTDHGANLLTDLTTDRALCNASTRPLIFIAHSLGGLVCKEAILLSRHNPEAHLQGIFVHVRGVIFMGTPHRGSVSLIREQFSSLPGCLLNRETCLIQGQQRL